MTTFQTAAVCAIVLLVLWLTWRTVREAQQHGKKETPRDMAKRLLDEAEREYLHHKGLAEEHHHAALAQLAAVERLSITVARPEQVAA